MTPKEKAEELVQRYIDNAYQEDNKGLYTPIAKQCALIAIDTFIPYISSVDTHPYFAQKINEFTKEYWKEVKIEIDKL